MKKVFLIMLTLFLSAGIFTACGKGEEYVNVTFQDGENFTLHVENIEYHNEVGVIKKGTNAKIRLNFDEGYTGAYTKLKVNSQEVALFPVETAHEYDAYQGQFAFNEDSVIEVSDVRLKKFFIYLPALSNDDYAYYNEVGNPIQDNAVEVDYNSKFVLKIKSKNKHTLPESIYYLTNSTEYLPVEERQQNQELYVVHERLTHYGDLMGNDSNKQYVLRNVKTNIALTLKNDSLTVPEKVHFSLPSTSLYHVTAYRAQGAGHVELTNNSIEFGGTAYFKVFTGKDDDTRKYYISNEDIIVKANGLPMELARNGYYVIRDAKENAVITVENIEVAKNGIQADLHKITVNNLNKSLEMEVFDNLLVYQDGKILVSQKVRLNFWVLNSEYDESDYEITSGNTDLVININKNGSVLEVELENINQNSTITVSSRQKVVPPFDKLKSKFKIEFKLSPDDNFIELTSNTPIIVPNRSMLIIQLTPKNQNEFPTLVSSSLVFINHVAMSSTLPVVIDDEENTVIFGEGSVQYYINSVTANITIDVVS